jgi:hypothetical protein
MAQIAPANASPQILLLRVKTPPIIANIPTAINDNPAIAPPTPSGPSVEAIKINNKKATTPAIMLRMPAVVGFPVRFTTSGELAGVVVILFSSFIAYCLEVLCIKPRWVGLF